MRNLVVTGDCDEDHTTSSTATRTPPRSKTWRQVLRLSLIVIALSLCIGAGPSAQSSGVDRTGFANPSDVFYGGALRAMQFNARRAGVRIDTDIDISLTAHGDVFYATIDGFENLDLRYGARDGVEVGFLFVRGAALMPVGYYVMQFVIDPGHLENAFAWLINASGQRSFMPLTIAVDPHPERGPRKLLTTEGGATRPTVRPGIGIGDLVVNGDLEL